MRLFLLGILLSFSTGASEQFFVESLPVERAKTLEEVLREIDHVASKKQHLVSLGESHLHPYTAHALANILIERYVATADEFRFCSEQIGYFLAHPAAQALQGNARETFIGQRNSPSYTDFRDCRKRAIDGYFTYSGFFHQLPFARAFPLEFAPTAVITRDGENIRDQLKENNALFIVQIELEFIEQVTQARVLRNPPETVEQFRSQVSQLKAAIRSVKSAQEVVVGAALKEREKNGVFVPHSGAYLLVTDLAYRQEFIPLPLLNSLANLSDESLNFLLKKLASSPAYVTSAIQEPDENGQLYQTGYGTVPWLFPANSTFLETRIVPGENLLMSAAPGQELPTCIAYKSLGPSIVECNSYLADLAQ